MKRIALVTGGTGGIGSAICKKLSQDNCKVIAGFNNSGDDSRAKEWKDEMVAQGFDVDIQYGDVASFESTAGMIAEIEQAHGPISILVNNAGITRDGVLKKLSWEKWESVLRINLDSVFNTSRNVIEGMIERKYGRIVNISSINGQKGQFGQTNYSAAKAGMHGFTKALAQEVAMKGITVNTISPGYVATAMVKKINPEILQSIIDGVPMKRLAEPDEIGRTVAFLAHEDSGFISGANIPVNGGQYMI